MGLSPNARFRSPVAQVPRRSCCASRSLVEWAVEFATLEWVNWFNHRRLLEPLGYIPPVQFEEEYYRQTAQEEETVLKPLSLQ